MDNKSVGTFILYPTQTKFLKQFGFMGLKNFKWKTYKIYFFYKVFFIDYLFILYALVPFGIIG